MAKSEIIQTIRGFKDYLPAESQLRLEIISSAIKTAQNYGFAPIELPIAEYISVFARSLGESSDVVSKEMYSFFDRNNEQLVLRPEFTAAAVRAFLQAKLTQDLPVKWCYHGPAFRYERPQKGRQRQFTQFGIEWFGADGAICDIEVVALANALLAKLGIVNGRNITLEINSLGDSDSRNSYRQALIEYLQKYENELSEDSRKRLTQNPLRILDSKNEHDRKLLEDAPKITQYYSDNAKEHFDNVLDGLENLGINYNYNPHLVRGLDYYSHSCFEFISDELGAQGTILAGGRYDGLVSQMGGPEINAIGWAMGIERISAILAEHDNYQDKYQDKLSPLVTIIAMASDNQQITTEINHSAMKIAGNLRQELQDYVDILAMNSLGKAMKKANKLKSRYALIIGEEEAAKQIYILKDLSSAEQYSVKEDEIATHIRNYGNYSKPH